MAILKDILNQVTFDEVWTIISQKDSRTDTTDYKETFSGTRHRGPQNGNPAVIQAII